MSSYISYLSPASWTRAQKNKSDLEKTNPTNPVLKDEDEEFLTRITSQEGVAPPLPERKDGGLSKIEPSVIGDDGEEKEVSDEQKEKAAKVVKDEGVEGPAVVPEKAVEAKDEKADETKDEKKDEIKGEEENKGKDDERKVDLEQSDVVDGAAVKTDKVSEEEPKTEEDPVVEQEDKDIHSTDDSKPAKEEDSEDTKSDDKVEAKSDDKAETASSDKTGDKPDDKAEDKTEAKSEDNTDDKSEAKTDDKSAEKDAKPTKKWASYIPSIPSIPSIPNLTKKKDSSSTSAKEEPKVEEPKTEETPSSPTSPKAKKAKNDPFPTQEEAEATTTAGTSQSSAKDAKQSSSPTEPTGRQTEDVSNPNTRTWASYIPNISRNNPSDSLDSAIKKGKAKEEPLKNPDGSQTDDEKEVSVLLDNLNLSAINNRVFSFSQQSQKVYEDFTVVLKDIVNGGPTAYEDLEKLIKENEGQLDSMFGNMPPFVQTLVKSLPSKFAGSLGPEVLAAMSEKPGNDLKVHQAAEASSSSTASVGDSALKVPEGKKKQKRKIPGVKALVSEQGAVASMLRSILAFLKTRFPAFVTGTNVLMSLAVFILLFVFWYCHKRGKEVRLLKEKESASADVSEIEESDSDLDESNVLEKAQRDLPEVEEDKWIKEKEAEGKDEQSAEGESEEKAETKEETTEETTEETKEEKDEKADVDADSSALADDKDKEEVAETEDEDIHTTSTSKPAKEEETEKAT